MTFLKSKRERKRKMRTIKLILSSMALVILFVSVSYDNAMSEDIYAAKVCVDPTQKGALALERTECDEDAEAYSYNHGVLRVLTPQDPVNPAVKMCIYPKVAYVCVGVPPANPPAQSYVWYTIIP
jgi:hypothetical protein